VIDLGGCQLINLDTGQKLLPGAATAGYCPPESEQPYSALTPAADVYTVGSNLFQILSGRSPAEFLPPGFASTQARAAPLDEKLLDGPCSAERKRLVRRCLDPDPQKRFPNAGALHEAMNSILLGTA